MNNIKAGLIVCFIFYFMPPSQLITDNGFYSCGYRIFVSLLCIEALRQFCSRTITVRLIAYIEIIAILSSLLMLFTPFSQHLPVFAFDLLSLNYQNYQALPNYLFLLQIAILVFSAANGIFRKAKFIFNLIVANIRGRRNDLRLSDWW